MQILVTHSDSIYNMEDRVTLQIDCWPWSNTYLPSGHRTDPGREREGMFAACFAALLGSHSVSPLA